MKNRIICVLCLLLVFTMVLPQEARAVEPLDTGRVCSLTLHYGKDGTPFTGLKVEIYRVAQAYADGTYELLSAFRNYPVNIHDAKSRQEWKDTATTLAAYLKADQIAPTATAQTDGSGAAVFENLTTGMYLVMGAVAEDGSGIYGFQDFLLYIPMVGEDGSYNYDAQAVPKPGTVTEKTSYSVRKLWKDAGYPQGRPKSVTVDILKNGVVQETVELSADNNWCYRWEAPYSADQWSVVERNTPQGYQVSIREADHTFTITNSRPYIPGTPPKTGDTFLLLPWVLAMSFSGMVLMAAGLWHKRKKQ